MSFSKIVISIGVMGLFGVALAQEEARVKIEVITDDGNSDGVHVAIDSDDLGFNLQDMQEGENQAIVDEQGRTILVTREADGFTFDVEGKSIKMPMISADHEEMIAMHGEHAENVEVHVVHDVVEIDGEHDEHHEVKIVKKVEVISD